MDFIYEIYMKIYMKIYHHHHYRQNTQWNGIKTQYEDNEISLNESQELHSYMCNI